MATVGRELVGEGDEEARRLEDAVEAEHGEDRSRGAGGGRRTGRDELLPRNGEIGLPVAGARQVRMRQRRVVDRSSISVVSTLARGSVGEPRKSKTAAKATVFETETASTMTLAHTLAASEDAADMLARLSLALARARVPLAASLV
jgi:hypothetical protein